METTGPQKREKNSKSLQAKVEGITKRYEHCSFESFIPSSQNKRHFEICQSLQGESITLTGKTGTGKTHLAISILKEFPMQLMNEGKQLEAEKYLKWELERNYDSNRTAEVEALLKSGSYKYRAAYCLFLPVVEMFLNLNEASYNSGESGKLKLLDKYTQYDCLCLDDLGAEKLTEASRQNLYAVIDRRYRELKPIIVTSNFLITEINNVEPRIASRLSEMGKILQFDGEDFRLKHQGVKHVSRP